MNENAQRLLSEALALPESERADLAAGLIDSLDEVSEAEAEAAWQEEIRRRIAAYDSGAVTGIPWSEIRATLTSRSDGSI